MKEVKSEPNPEFEAFDRTMEKILSVSHDELKRRMDEYNKGARQNPHKRGPKSKVKISKPV
jgi:hypothetical protein